MQIQEAMTTGRFVFERDGDICVASLHGPMSIEQWRDFLATATARVAQKPKFVFVVDCLDLASFPPEARKLLVAWRKQHHARYEEYFYGVSYVIKSALFRAALQATFWLLKPPVPFVFSSTREGAIAWAESLIRRVS
jgi:hypothetical protein